MKIALLMGPRPEAGCGMEESACWQESCGVYFLAIMARSHLKIYQQMGGFSYANRH